MPASGFGEFLELRDLRRVGLRLLRDVREEILEALLLRELRGDEALHERLLRLEEIAPHGIDVGDDAARGARGQDRARAFHAVLRAGADVAAGGEREQIRRDARGGGERRVVAQRVRRIVHLAVLRRLGLNVMSRTNFKFTSPGLSPASWSSTCTRSTCGPFCWSTMVLPFSSASDLMSLATKPSAPVLHESCTMTTGSSPRSMPVSASAASAIMPTVPRRNGVLPAM